MYNAGRGNIKACSLLTELGECLLKCASQFRHGGGDILTLIIFSVLLSGGGPPGGADVGTGGAGVGGGAELGGLDASTDTLLLSLLTVPLDS